jgi:hypothetical protein
MSSKRIEIFKKALNSLNKSLKCHAFIKKTLHSQKRASWQLHDLKEFSPERSDVGNGSAPKTSDQLISKVELIFLAHTSSLAFLDQLVYWYHF